MRHTPHRHTDMNMNAEIIPFPVLIILFPVWIIPFPVSNTGFGILGKNAKHFVE